MPTPGESPDPTHGNRPPAGSEPRTPDEDPGSGDLAEPRRLHPASVVLGVNPRVLIQNYIIPAFAGAAAAGFALSAVVVIGIIGLVVRVLVWQRFTYAFDGEVLRVDEGVLSRNRRALDVDRIQQVEIDRGAVQRIFGLATLRVETASGAGGGAAELRVIDEQEATRLRTALRAGQERLGVPTETTAEGATDDRPARREIIRVPLRHVVFGAVTGARLLVFPAVIAGAFQFAGPRTQAWVEAVADEAVRYGLLERNGGIEVTPSAVLTIAGAVLVASVVTAAAVGVLRDARFRIEDRSGDLHVTRGLLSTRSSVLPLNRVQLVAVQRNWLRRLLGFAVVRVSSAGGGGGERRVTVPLLPETDVEGLLPELYPGATGTPDLVGHPPKAMRRAIFRWVRKFAYLVAALWLAPFEWLEPLRTPSLGLLAVAVVLGVVEYRQLAHGTDDQLVAARRGALSVTTSLAPLTKVQAVTTAANPFQRRLGLALVVAHVAGPGGDVTVLDAGADDAARLHERLTQHAADPTSTGLDPTTVAAETAASEDIGGVG